MAHADIRAAATAAQAAAEAAQTAANAAAQALTDHASDPDAHEELFAQCRRHVVAVRARDPSKPDYGLDAPPTVVLEVEPYTGGAEIAAIVSGVEYDAKNMSASGDNVPDGTLILRKVEE